MLYGRLAVLIGLVFALAAPRLAAQEKKKSLDFTGQEITSQRFEQRFFANAIFTNAVLKNVSFIRTELIGANFRGAAITECFFWKADLTNADLRGAKLIKPGFDTTILNGAILEGVDLSDSPLVHCDLRGANLRNLKGISEVRGSDFFRADLRGANLAKMKDFSNGMADFRKARYDSRTRWPTAFDPVEAGALLEKDDPLTANQDLPNPKVDLLGKGRTNETPIQPELGDVQLSGLYVQVRTTYSIYRGVRSMGLDYIHYYFFADGRLFFGVPPGGTVNTPPGPGDSAAMQKNAPHRCGTYTIRAGQMVIRLPDKKPETVKFTLEKPGSTDVIQLGGLGAVKVGSFQAGQKLAARYESPRKTNAPLEFFADGACTSGTYHLSGNTLTIRDKAGITKLVTVYPMPDTDEFPPNRMWIDNPLNVAPTEDAVYKLQKR